MNNPFKPAHHLKLEEYNDRIEERNKRALARWSFFWHKRGGSRNSKARAFPDLRTDAQQGHWLVMVARAERVREWAYDRFLERRMAELDDKVIPYRARVRS